MILSPGAFLRVGLLLLVAVVLELSALSQLTVFGGHADLVVLVVAAVAYYGGSVTGCATGFSAGLLLDLLTGTTMGASSLVLTAVGYGVGRFREVRDPSHGLLPVAVGTVATACWVVAFAAVGADARHRRARQPAGAARHDRHRAAQRAAGAAGVHGLPQAAAPVAGGRPDGAAPPAPPAARGRPARACEGPGDLMYLDNERRPTLTPQLAVRVAILGGIALAAFGIIFFRLWFLQVLSGEDYVKAAQNNQAARSGCRRRAATSSTARGACWWRTASAWRSRSRPTSCPPTATSAGRSTAASAGC